MGCRLVYHLHSRALRHDTQVLLANPGLSFQTTLQSLMNEEGSWLNKQSLAVSLEVSMQSRVDQLDLQALFTSSWMKEWSKPWASWWHFVKLYMGLPSVISFAYKIAHPHSLHMNILSTLWQLSQDLMLSVGLSSIFIGMMTLSNCSS